jgi:hypothetical protein
MVAEGTRCTTIQPLIPLLLLVLLALSIGAIAGLRRARRRHAEERLVAEATPRVTARLAGLRGGIGPESSVPFDAPAMAPAPAMAAAAPESFIPPVPAARPRSISSALVPWAGARAAASRAASVAVTHAYPVHPGEAAIMRRAPMALDGDLWRSQDMPGETGRAPADPRWRMWRDASAALVAFALVGLVLVGGDLLRIPTGPLPPTPGLAAAVSQPSAAPTPTAVAVADPSGPQYPLVLITPTPGPVVAPVLVPAADPTPPLTVDRTPPPTPRPTPKPTPRPTPKPTPKPTPSLDPAFYCDTYNPPALQALTCQVATSNGGTVGYQWLVSDDGSAYRPVDLGPDGRSVSLTFALPGYYYVEVVLTRGSTSVTSEPAAFTVGL